MRTMYDSVNPSAIPALQLDDMVAYYCDGRYAWPTAALDEPRFVGHTLVSITVLGDKPADVCDCEKYDLTGTQAAGWYKEMTDEGRAATIYCSLGRAPGVVAACNAIGITEPKLWVADWTNLPHMVSVPGATVVAVQWTSDTQLDYDESLVTDTWEPSVTVQASVSDPTPSVPDVTAEGAAIIACVSRPAGGGWVVFADGSVWSVAPAPFYGSYGDLPAADREAPPKFVGAIYGDGSGHDGYTLIAADWQGADAGLYHFGPAIHN